MSDNTTDDTAEWLQQTETIEATLHTPDDRELPIEVEDITRDELDALEAQSRPSEGEDPAAAEDEAIQHAIREYLVNPDVDPDSIPMRKRSLLWFAMQQAWSGAEEIQAAVEDMQLPGNGML